MPGLASTATATPISQTYFFGASNSDTGNLFVRTAGMTAGPPYYWEGRFSNGPMWPDYFAGDLGTDSTASELGGTNYATGGSYTTGPAPLPFLDPRFHSLAGQVSDYLVV
jgi:phospholipase/lecithinase/hemolysin